MGFKKRLFLNEAGQSTVEYILLFSVVIAMVSLVIKSTQFKKVFGEEGDFATIYKREIEFSYRNALLGRKAFIEPNYRNNDHESYKGRFFVSKDAYPRQ